LAPVKLVPQYDYLTVSEQMVSVSLAKCNMYATQEYG
jgi:hypothetical protein